MNTGKILVAAIVTSAAAIGITIYWLQVYAFYTPAVFEPGREIGLTLIENGQTQPISATDVTGIDANSSPLRFRACFKTPLSQAILTETYVAYEGATPLIGPSWFDCYDAERIGAALEQGKALAFLSKADVAPGFDRVVAVFPDGQGFVWHQISSAKIPPATEQ